jgi:ankyrin repeat protein
MRRSFLAVSVAVLLSVAVSAAAPLTLLEAVKAGDAAAIRSALRQKPNVNAAEADGTTALHWAARANDMETVQLLLRAGANAKAANRYGVSPIGLAATNGNAAMIEALLKAGADANTANEDGETALMTAARSGKADAVKVLIANGANVNARENWQDQTALMFAAAENNAAAVKALVEGGADMNLKSRVWNFPEYKYQTNGMAVFQLPRGGWTALMYAARQNASEAAAMLADLKADMNAQDPDGTTALQLAILNVNYDLATMLLYKGADPNVGDNSGMTALYAAIDMRSPAGMMTRPNPKVLAEIDAGEMVNVLLKRGANPNLQLKKPIIGRHNNLLGDTSLGDGATALMRAVKGNDIPMVRALLENGADPTLTLADRTNAAMISNSLDVIKLMVEHGVDVNAFNANGQTLAHSAAGRGANAIIQFVADNGARLDKKDKQGRTPLDIASGAGGGAGGRGGGRGGRGAGGPAAAGAPGAGNTATADLIRSLLAKNAK